MVFIFADFLAVEPVIAYNRPSHLPAEAFSRRGESSGIHFML